MITDSLASTLLATLNGGERGWIGSWSPGIGDPTFVGWFTVVAYFAAAYLCWRAFRRLQESSVEASVQHGGQPTSDIVPIRALLLAFAGRRRRVDAISEPGRRRALWFGLTVILGLLGVNKQLDLQTALTELARLLAVAQGWYEMRHPVQIAFIAFVALIGLVTFRAALLLARGDLGHVRAALGGVLFLTCFVIIRAASFHHIDEMLGYDIDGLRINGIIELGGISFIAAGAYREGRRRRPSSPLAG